MNQPHPPCPNCGSTDPQFRPRRQEYICEDCGHRWSLQPQDPALDWPAGLAPADLPTYLAAPLAALVAEGNPRVRLHWLVDCAEIALRWSVAVTLAQVIQAHAGTLPEPIVQRLRAHIERPTLGRWLGILAALSHPRPTGDLPAPGFFDLYDQAFAPRFRTEGQGGTQNDSLLIMRNDLVHGAGLQTAVARSWLERHQPAIFDLVRAVARAGLGTQVIALSGGQAVRLAGPHPVHIPCPALLRDRPDGPWLVAGSAVLPLLPLAGFGPVRLVDGAGRPEERPGDPAAQLYQRAKRERLEYVPLGRDEAVSLSFDLDAFRALFRLDFGPASSRGASGAEVRWDDFLREARVLADDLVGRDDERAHLSDWLKGRDTRQENTARIGLVTGAPGVGKSLLMARLATDQGNARPERQALYYHRFRGGDARNSTRAFLQGLLAALAEWPLLPAPPAADGDPGDSDADLLEAARVRLAAVAALVPTRPQAPAPRVLVLVDGLDEALPQDPRLPQRLRDLALPGTVWLVASRPDPALDRALGGPGCDRLFPKGLPPMSATDIRAMLMEGLASARQALVARDLDDADATQDVHNPFVDRVVACADGLPLYVHLLLEDLRHGRLTVHDEDRLPRGLVAYYDTLMERGGLSDVRRDLPLLVACLARAEEPLGPEALTLFLADAPAEARDYAERVQRAKRAGQALLRDAPTPDGTAGLTLYHQSFRDYVGGGPTSPPAPALAGTVREVERKLCRLADGWAGLPPGNLRNHLFRWGVRYAMRWQGAVGLEAARRRLTDFTFLQAFTADLPSGAIRGLVADYETLLARLPAGAEWEEFRLWEAFFREREHILRRGDVRWPAHKILLQLAVEHADDSPVTRAAEAWLSEGHCDWVWLRNPRRVARAVPDPCLRVLEGHTGTVKGALELYDGRVLSWSLDKTLRLWDEQSGAPLATLAGHTDTVQGVRLLADGRFLSWSWDKTLRLWDGQYGAPLATLQGHTDWVMGALELSDGRILSWPRGDTPRLWDGQSGAPLASLQGHTGTVNGVLELSDGRILSWSWDETLRLWDGQSGAPLATLEGHATVEGNSDWGNGALELSDGRILSWSLDKTLRLWNGQSGASLATLVGHTSRVTGALELSDGRILSWSSDHTLRLWDEQRGAPLATLEGHTTSIGGALELSDGRILSWSDDLVSFEENTLCLWDGRNGGPLAILEGHTSRINGVRELSDGRILSWSHDNTLRLWNGQNGAPLATLLGHTSGVLGAMELSDGCILSWSPDGSLRLWGRQSGTTIATLEGHAGFVEGVRKLSDGRILSWSPDKSWRLWDGQSSAPLGPIKTAESVLGALELSDGRIFSWSRDKTPRLWKGQSGAHLAVWEGYARGDNCALELDDGRILLWSWDETLRLWNGQSGAPLATLEGHTDWAKGALELSDGRILSWSRDETLRLWDGQSGAPLATLEGHAGWIEGALALSDGRILSWSYDKTLRLWDGQNGVPLATLRGHAEGVEGALELSDGRILSWSRDETLRLWDRQSGTPLATLEGHAGWIEGALALSDGRILSWSADHTLRLWDGQCGQPVSGPIRPSDLPWESPQLLLSWRGFVSPQSISGQSVAWNDANTAGIASCIARPVCWHGHSAVKSQAILPQGILVVSLASGHVFCLQLYRGVRRITVEDYEHGD